MEPNERDIKLLGTILYITGYCDEYAERENAARIWLNHDSISRGLREYADEVRAELTAPTPEVK